MKLLVFETTNIRKKIADAKKVRKNGSANLENLRVMTEAVLGQEQEYINEIKRLKNEIKSLKKEILSFRGNET